MSGRWKHIALLTVTAALALVVAAFSSARTGKISGPAASQATNLTIMGFGTNGDDVAMTRFHRAEAAVGGNVDAPNGGFDDQQFLAALASGNVPDLVYLDRSKVGTYAAKGAFLPLTSCISSKKIVMSQYRTPAVQEVTYKGKVYGIPEFYTARTIIASGRTPTTLDLEPYKLSKVASDIAVGDAGDGPRRGRIGDRRNP